MWHVNRLLTINKFIYFALMCVNKTIESYDQFCDNHVRLMLNYTVCHYCGYAPIISQPLPKEGPQQEGFYQTPLPTIFSFKLSFKLFAIQIPYPSRIFIPLDGGKGQGRSFLEPHNHVLMHPSSAIPCGVKLIWRGLPAKIVKTP